MLKFYCTSCRRTDEGELLKVDCLAPLLVSRAKSGNLHLGEMHCCFHVMLVIITPSHWAFSIKICPPFSILILHVEPQEFPI